MRVLNIVNPSRDFWIVCGSEEEEGGEGGDEVRETLTTAKYPYLATGSKQIQITVPVIEESVTATHGEAFDWPCCPSYPTG